MGRHRNLNPFDERNIDRSFYIMCAVTIVLAILLLIAR